MKLRMIVKDFGLWFQRYGSFIGWMDTREIKGYNNDAGEDVGFHEYGKDKEYCI